jgi:hypothetical protein
MRPVGGREACVSVALLTMPIVAITAYISNTKNENSFYVAAIVKPLSPFFPSLASFLEELCHIVLISLYICILVLTRTGMAMRVSTSQSRDDPTLILDSTPLLPVTWPRAGWRLPVALRPSSPTTFYPCGLQRPSPNTLCVLRHLLEGPAEATPPMRRRAVQARNFRGSPPPAPQPRRDAAASKRLSLFEHRPLR